MVGYRGANVVVAFPIFPSQSLQLPIRIASDINYKFFVGE